MKCRVCGGELSEGTLFCGQCGSSVTATRVRPPAVPDPRGSDTSIVQPLSRDRAASAERHRPALVGRFQPGDDRRPAAQDEGEPVARDAGPVFTLSFSTGESVRVSGSGLVGRRPITQPGETVDRIVTVDDPARSVSKTHLEFGIEAGELWICDRYSGNGTVAHPLGGPARQCEPGRRYRVTRGTRVDIGDQWFDVS